MEERRSRRGGVWTGLALAVGALLLAGEKGPGRVWERAAFNPLPSSSAAELNPWAVAAKLVTEDRGEPTGRQAEVEVPEQLKHYSDKRRFLAIQVAEWREHTVSTPHDYAGLAALISAGEMVAVPNATESFVLYGVGALADTEAFTHFDKAAGESIAIFDEAELAAEYARLDGSDAHLRAELDTLRQELDSLGKSERTRRNKLRAQITKHEKTLKASAERRASLETFYGDAARRAELSAERAALASLAADFDGSEYDLSDPRSRRELKVRMLSHLRPEALSVLKELAESYQAKFNRPLPVTSLVRPDEYQRRLSRSNSNATRIETPPHSTGLAFDILYKHMTAEEQEHVMSDIARLRDAGRVEALRENRDHFHVFAFVDGRRPGEDLIRQSLGHSAKARAEEEPTEAPAEKSSKAEKKKNEKKAESKVEKKNASKKGAAKNAVAKKAVAKRADKPAARKRR
ncbi:MAG TPA: DUF5715 family protein [Pyrinomonadaceae bacterium]|nr:DUF5715 family protein [Pyrinomonadaceae bacterium]